MINPIKRYIKQQVVKAALPLGIDITKQYTDFILNAPVRQWKSRLWVVTHTAGLLSSAEMEDLVLFLDK